MEQSGASTAARHQQRPIVYKVGSPPVTTGDVNPSRLTRWNRCEFSTPFRQCSRAPYKGIRHQRSRRIAEMCSQILEHWAFAPGSAAEVIRKAV